MAKNLNFIPGNKTDPDKYYYEKEEADYAIIEAVKKGREMIWKALISLLKALKIL